MNDKFTFILAAVFCLTTPFPLQADLVHPTSSSLEGAAPVKYAMKGPKEARSIKITVPSYPLPEEPPWDKQWLKQEFEQGVAKFVFKDMIGEKGYKYFTLSNPPRIVFDIKEPKHLPPSPWYHLPLKGWAFQKMRIGTYPDKVRFVLDLAEDEFLKPSVYTVGADLIVMVGPFSKIFQAAEPPSGAEKPLSTDTADMAGNLPAVDMLEKPPSADTADKLPSAEMVEKPSPADLVLAQPQKITGLPAPTEGPAQPQEGAGGRTLAEIREVVEAHIGGLRFLYNKELRANPSLNGKVTIMFEIAPSGEVIQTAVLSSSLKSKSLEGAILENIRNWKFSETSQKSGNVKVTHPFIFMPPTI